MQRVRVVSISYHSSSPKTSILWLHQLISKLLIEKLELKPNYAGDFIHATDESLVNLIKKLGGEVDDKPIKTNNQ